MSLETKDFLEDLFGRFNNNSSEFRFLHYEHTDFEFPYVSKMSELFEDMHDISYDRKDAVIHMSTKKGRIYSVDEINEFNEENKDYLKIIGVGNEIGSLTIDPGCAKLILQVNVNTYEKEVKELGYPDFEEKTSELSLEYILDRLKSNKKKDYFIEK
ncbi:MAG: hypothetical protein BZ138_02540 [Methanosphaera sp. rholeuAM270]|nr:MAG: hypothetical protein BZ138_02540 [Methanosphaera sp. rholeuAM270]